MEYRLRKVTPSKSVVEVKSSSTQGGWRAVYFGSHTAIEKQRITGASTRGDNAHNAALDDIKADVEALIKAL